MLGMNKIFGDKNGMGYDCSFSAKNSSQIIFRTSQRNH